MSDDLNRVARSLTDLMLRAAPGMAVKDAGTRGVHLLARWDNPLKPGQPMWFGGVQTTKTYVSVHLMPVYSHPALAASIPPTLRKRMQGKSCFNFRTEDPALFAELETLIRAAAAVYARPFTLERPSAPRA
ncbi:MAG TPA: hypothetical protein PLO65_15280 [Caulobacter sp.]|nr:hypothetical protein [Caulobacter sp.]